MTSCLHYYQYNGFLYGLMAFTLDISKLILHTSIIEVIFIGKLGKITFLLKFLQCPAIYSELRQI